MRILPHIILNSEKPFSKIAQNIFWDGIATHGHPKALLGAQLYGYALWLTFRMNENLNFNQLISILASDNSNWSNLPTQSDYINKWLQISKEVIPNYEDIWSETNFEIVELLEKCKLELEHEPNVKKALEQLNCFDKKIGGAGTITAVVSIYMAVQYSKYPLNGVAQVGQTTGIDTDTIASMAGGLLGCYHGKKWLEPVYKCIQDFEYITNVAKDLVNGNLTKEDKNTDHSFNLKNWKDSVFKDNQNKLTKLPDDRIVIRDDFISDEQAKFIVVYRNLKLDDGQSLFLKKIKKKPPAASLLPEITNNMDLEVIEKMNNIRRINVFSLDESLAFYKFCFGFNECWKNKGKILFREGILLIERNILGKQYLISRGFSIFSENIENSNQIIELLFEYRKKHNLKNPLIEYIGNGNFKCTDLDGNVIEVLIRIKRFT